MIDTHLWTGLSLVTPLEARVRGALPAGVTGVSIDSRTLERGDLFIAIRGENSDGHDYVRAAFEKGAAACVVDESRASELADAGPLYIVKDTQAAMERLGVAVALPRARHGSAPSPVRSARHRRRKRCA